MASKKAWIILGVLLAALLGASHAFAGVAIDNAVMLDPYDPVPPIQFTHWYAGGCARECGGCESSCYQRVRCDEGCYRERCEDGCVRCDGGCRRERCDNDCHRDNCERDCGQRDGCDRDCGQHDGCDRGCGEQVALPCNSSDCYESERWEHRFRDGNRVTEQWLDRGQQTGEQRENHHHHFSDDNDDDQDSGR